MLVATPIREPGYPQSAPCLRLPRAFRRGATRRRAVRRLVRRFAEKQADARAWRLRDGIVWQMCLAALHGDLPRLRRWLAAGVPANWDRRYAPETPMYYAAKGDQVAAAELLLAYGASVSPCQKRSETPLHWAVEHRAWRMTRWLLEKGCDPCLGWEGGVDVADVAYDRRVDRSFGDAVKTLRALLDAEPVLMLQLVRHGPDHSRRIYAAVSGEPMLAPPKARIPFGMVRTPRPFVYKRVPERGWLSHTWFVRHGESEADAGLPTRDPAAIELTQRGRDQAAAIAETIPAAPDLIVISPMARAHQTALPTLGRYFAASRQTWPIEEFTYLSPGEWAGSSRAMRREAVAAYWQRCDPYAAAPGAESFAAFGARVAEFWRRVAAAHRNQFVLVFGHGEFVRCALWLWHVRARGRRRLDMADYAAFRAAFSVANGAVVQTQVSENALWHAPLPHAPACFPKARA